MDIQKGEAHETLCRVRDYLRSLGEIYEGATTDAEVLDGLAADIAPHVDEPPAQ